MAPRGGQNAVKKRKLPYHCQESNPDSSVVQLVAVAIPTELSFLILITFMYLYGRLLARWFLAKLISPTLKMEAICSSETSVDTQRTTRRHIPEDDTLHSFFLLTGRATG
jgi:hypothetical protein